MRRFRRRNRSASATNRGQAALIGLVLLIGMVATVSVGIFLIAGDTVEQTEQEAETERVEGAFVELSQMMRSVASSSDTSSQVDLDLSDSGAVVMKNTSTMSIEYGDDESDPIDFGTIEYEGDDGTRIAYQGGAVFKETGNETQVVSAPPVSYVDDDGSETLSFPILEPTEEGSISSGEISATKEDNATVEFSETIDDGEVTINITGPYYRGWEEHFERQAGEDAIDSIDHDNNSVSILLTQSNFDTLFENAATVISDLDVGGSSSIEGDVVAGAELDEDAKDSIDGEVQDGVEIEIDTEAIENEIADTIANGSDEYDDLKEEIESGEDGTVTSGKYYADGYDQDIGPQPHDPDEIIFDVSDGDIDIVIEDEFSINGTHRVEGTNSGNEVNIYTNTEIEGDGIGTGASICVEECDPDNIGASHMTLYGVNDFALGGGFIFEGVIFAPSESIGESGNQEIYGSIFADKITLDGTSELTHDPELEGGPDIESGGGIPEIVYLNVAKHEIDLGT